MSDYRFHVIKKGYPFPTYSVTRKGETEPFGTVQQRNASSWTESASWSARSTDESVRAIESTREGAAKALEFRLLPADERARIRAEEDAAWEAKRAQAQAEATQRKLEALRSPEHQEEALVEAYHVLFDIKDAGDASQIADTKARAAWEALWALDALMREVGLDVPRRFDNDGRTVGNGGLPS